MRAFNLSIVVKSKTFENISELNNFLDEKKVKSVYIETVKEKYNTGLPTVRCGSFITEREVLKLWYDEI